MCRCAPQWSWTVTNRHLINTSETQMLQFYVGILVDYHYFEQGISKRSANIRCGLVLYKDCESVWIPWPLLSVHCFLGPEAPEIKPISLLHCHCLLGIDLKNFGQKETVINCPSWRSLCQGWQIFCHLMMVSLPRMQLRSAHPGTSGGKRCWVAGFLYSLQDV